MSVDKIDVWEKWEMIPFMCCIVEALTSFLFPELE